MVSVNDITVHPTTADLFTLTCDISYDQSFEELLDTLAEYSLRMTVLVPHGPAGGNPLVKFEGTRLDLINFITDCLT